MRDQDDHARTSRWFDQEAGVGPFINPDVPTRDFERLKTELGEVRTWVNKAVAHSELKPPDPPVFGEIHRCIDIVFELFHKYMLLIWAVAIDGEVLMHPWPRIFRTAWIPHDEWAGVMEHVRRAEREGVQDSTP
jgi:hypothetical protein